MESLHGKLSFTDAIYYVSPSRFHLDLIKCSHGQPILKAMNILEKYILKNNVPKKIGSIVNNTKLVKSLNVISSNGYSINNGKIGESYSKKFVS